MGRVVCPLRGHTTPRVSAIEILTTDLGVLYHNHAYQNTEADLTLNPGGLPAIGRSLMPHPPPSSE